jgi:hypothetical protein
MGLELAAFRSAFYDRGARMVALGCRAAGIDRSVFATVFNLSRQARGMAAVMTQPDTTAVDQVFTTFTRQDALDELRKTAS